MAQFAVIPSYAVYIGNQAGQRFTALEYFSSVQINMRLNGPHTLFLEFPQKDQLGRKFNPAFIGEDHWVEIWRGTDTSPTKRMIGQSPFLMQDFDYIESPAGVDVKIFAQSAARVAAWPIVAYDAGTAQSAKTDNADDTIKAIARENFGSSATDTDRDMSVYITIEGDSSEGVSLTKAFTRRRLIDVFNELCEASANQGTRLYWDIILPNPGNLDSRVLELRTYAGQRGDNHGNGVDNPLIFSVSRGNLERATLTQSYVDSVNYAYGLGQGVESSRNVQDVSDSDRVAASIWGRIKEGSRQANQANTDAGVQAEANALLRERRPGEVLEIEVSDAPGSQFGVNWNHGDLCIVEALGKRYEVIMSPVSIRYASGQESITCRPRIEAVL